MNENKIKSILKEILTELETKVYLASLAGPLTIQELAKKAGLNRSGTYRLVENLIAKGLLSRELKTSGQRIIAEHPKKILQLLGNSQRKLRRKELEFKELMPDMLANFNIGENKPQIKVYEGVEGLEKGYEIMLEECENGEQLALSGDMDLVLQIFDDSFWKEWNKKFFDKNNSARMIVNDSKKARGFKEKYDGSKLETKIISNFELKTDINIFNDKVLISSFKDKIAILISSKFIANSYRILFETVWVK